MKCSRCCCYLQFTKRRFDIIVDSLHFFPLFSDSYTYIMQVPRGVKRTEGTGGEKSEGEKGEREM